MSFYISAILATHAWGQPTALGTISRSGAAKRAALVEAMELKNYEFNAHGVELGQFYTSTAIVGDATSKLSTLDLAPHTRFTLITGIAGEAWADAAAQVAKDLQVPLETVVIGPGREITDIYYDWARIREVEEDGALLVRPDKHIGWRSMTLPGDPERDLRNALVSLLNR